MDVFNSQNLKGFIKTVSEECQEMANDKYLGPFFVSNDLLLINHFLADLHWTQILSHWATLSRLLIQNLIGWVHILSDQLG